MTLGWRRVLQVFATTAGHTFRLLPRRHRFAAARFLALAFAPVLRRLPYYSRRPSSLDGYREESHRIVLRTMARARVTFDPDVVFRGAPLPDGPAILASAHMLLDVHMTRAIYDRGQTLTAVLGGPREVTCYSGTLEPIDVIYIGNALFLQMRARLRQGNLVFMDLDSDREVPGCMRVDTAGGPRWVSDKLLKFAADNGTPLVFVVTRIDEDRRLVVTCERPSSSDPAVMLREYCEFLRGEAALVKR